VHCRAGDFVVWDSRTIHCNSPAIAIEERCKNQPIDLLRIVAYVSMSPTSFVNDEKLDEFREKRKEIVENNCTTTHWSTELVLGGEIFIEMVGFFKIHFMKIVLGGVQTD
jgi:predicted RNA-binding protein with EMAP domain